MELGTQDADLAYQRSDENHLRLLAALGEMEAHIRRREGFLIPLPTDDPGLLEERNIWSLRTRHGDVDLIYAPPGGGYEVLLPDAQVVNVQGYPVLVASMDDLIRSKELANRDKDRQSLAELRRFRDQQKRDRAGPGLPLDP